MLKFMALLILFYDILGIWIVGTHLIRLTIGAEIGGIRYAPADPALTHTKWGMSRYAFHGLVTKSQHELNSVFLFIYFLLFIFY